MITVVIHSSRSDGRLVSCSAIGHSMYAENGSDIVCAAVSVLMTNCVNSLETVCGVLPEMGEFCDGRMSFSLPEGLTQAQQHDCQILMKSLQQGIRDVVQMYPENVRLSMK